MAWKEVEIVVAVPSYFKCPISLDLMSDPVSVSTGMTYDRSSIEKWLDDGHRTCPATMQTLHTQDLIPNHTLRRLIQAWCVSNKSMGVERIPTPKQPLDRHDVQLLLKDIAQNDIFRIDALKNLRNKAKESLRNRKCIADAGAVPVLSSILSSSKVDQPGSDMDVCEETLGILSILPMNDGSRGIVAGSKQLSCLSWVLRKGSLDARINAANLLEDLISYFDVNRVVGSTEGMVDSLAELLRENLNQTAVKAALRALSGMASSRRECRRMAEVGVVDTLVEMLPSADKSTAESVLVMLAALCRCAEGRAAVAEHALAIPAITNRISAQVSVAIAEASIAILWALCSLCADEETVHERAVESGLFTKLLILLQMEFSASTKHKMADILRLLRNVCKDHPNRRSLSNARSMACI